MSDASAFRQLLARMRIRDLDIFARTAQRGVLPLISEKLMNYYELSYAVILRLKEPAGTRLKTEIG